MQDAAHHLSTAIAEPQCISTVDPATLSELRTPSSELRAPTIARGEIDLLSAAGLTWSMELPSGEKSRCFVIITREARDASGEVHDRMPAFLTPDTWDTWLSPEKLTGDRKTEALAMLEHTSSDVAATIREHIVDRKVSNSRTVDPSDPTLIDAVEQSVE